VSEPTELETFLFEEVQRQKKRIKRLEKKARVANANVEVYRNYAADTLLYVNSLQNVPKHMEQEILQAEKYLTSALSRLSHVSSRVVTYNTTRGTINIPSMPLPPNFARDMKKRLALAPKPKKTKPTQTVSENDLNG
jgi:hypothetical protein